jgi:hypothetical protein
MGLDCASARTSLRAATATPRSPRGRAEAYLGDVPRPLKSRWPDFVAVEQRAYQAIAARFGVSAVTPDAV